MKWIYLLFSIKSFLFALETDYLIVIFDNGEKNIVASMLSTLEASNETNLKNIDFKIVFMGASIDAMHDKPFSSFPEKMVHYKQLGIEEDIDRFWKRDQSLSVKSLRKLQESIRVRKKLLVGVSCLVCKNLLETFSEIETIALWDNPNPNGASDYFPIAREVVASASKVFVPGIEVFQALSHPNKVITGHPSSEDWEKEALKISKVSILSSLSLDHSLPIIIFAGAYGDLYEKRLRRFLEVFPKDAMHLIIAPHPRFQGELESRICPSYLTSLTSLEALVVADGVVVPDPTSTIVFQAKVLKKKIYFAHEKSTREEILEWMSRQEDTKGDFYQEKQIPRGGAKRLLGAFFQSLSTLGGSMPEYLYKIVSKEHWETSKNLEALKLSEQDEAFIHFSTEEQLEGIIKKYWSSVLEFYVLKVVVSGLPGEMRHEINPGGERKYYHLYDGSIPINAIVNVQKVVRR